MTRRKTFPACRNLCVALSLLLLIASCGGDDSPNQPVPTEDVLATGTIGAEGGSVASPQISLEIPAGAFPTATEITLVRTTENVEGTAASPAFRIDGLPETFSQPLTVRFPAPAGEATPIYLVGEQAYISSFDEITYSFRPAQPASDGEELTVTLPAIADRGALPPEKAYEHITSVTLVEQYEPHYLLSANGNFHITWLGSAISEDDISALAGDLEDAYEYYQALGFSYEARDSWPVQVLVKLMPFGKYGCYSNSKRGDNHGYIDFNTLYITERQTMRVTAGHEFFHLVQSFHDQRGSYVKAVSKTRHHWLNEAAAVWAEAAFAGDPNYVSAARDGVEVKPFNGMEAGSLESSEAHGYGMSAMVKYLVTQHGLEVVRDIYANLQTDQPATHAVNLAVGSPNGWYGEFLKQYVLGGIYTLPPVEVAGLRKGSFPINNEQDNYWSSTLPYPDLSGHLFTITLQDPSLSDAASLDLNLGGDHPRLMAFSYNSSTMTFLGEGNGTLHIPGLRAIDDSGRNILVLAMRLKGEPDYVSTETNTLTAHVNRPSMDLSSFSEVYFRWGFNLEQLFGDGSTGQVGMAATDFHGTGFQVTGTQFSGTVDSVSDWNGFYTLRYEGEVSGTFNAAMDTILTVTASLYKEYTYADENVVPSYRYTMTARNLPLDSYWPGSSAVWQRIEGEACPAVVQVSYESYQQDWVSTGFNCDDLAYPYVQLSVQIPLAGQ